MLKFSVVIKVSVNVNLGKSTNESILLLGEIQLGLPYQNIDKD